jgi:hypothetical protein
MAQKNVVVSALPWLATVFTAAVVLIASVSFDAASFGALWPAIPMMLFFSLAVSAFMPTPRAGCRAPFFLGFLFFFWMLAKLDVMPFGKSWPFLVLIAGVLIVVGNPFVPKGKRSGIGGHYGRFGLHHSRI